MKTENLLVAPYCKKKDLAHREKVNPKEGELLQGKCPKQLCSCRHHHGDDAAILKG